MGLQYTINRNGNNGPSSNNIEPLTLNTYNELKLKKEPLIKIGKQTYSMKALAMYIKKNPRTAIVPHTRKYFTKTQLNNIFDKKMINNLGITLTELDKIYKR